MEIKSYTWCVSKECAFFWGNMYKEFFYFSLVLYFSFVFVSKRKVAEVNEIRWNIIF